MRLGNGINSKSEYFDVACGKRGDRESENQLEQLSSSESLVTIRLGRADTRHAMSGGAGDGAPGANPRHMHHTAAQINTDLGSLFRGAGPASVCVTLTLTRDEQQSLWQPLLNGHQMF